MPSMFLSTSYSVNGTFKAVADTGFPVGVGGGGGSLQHAHFLAEMYVKTKELGGDAPLGSTNAKIRIWLGSGWYNLIEKIAKQ